MYGTDPNTGAPTRQATPIGGATRAQQLGDVAANRTAYQPSFAQSDQARGSQTDSLAMARAAAMGQQPSQAQLLGRNMLDQGLQAQLAGAASARGGPMQQAAAMRQAQQGAAAFQQQGTNNLAAMRAQEMATARDQYGQQAAGIRTADMGQAALMSQNELAQRQLNQQGQLGFNQQAIDVNKANATNSLGQYAIDSQNWQDAANNAAARQRQESDISQHSTDRTTGLLGSVIGGGAAAGVSIVGSLFGSDERMKTPVSMTKGITGAVADGAKAFGAGMGAAAAGYYPTNMHSQPLERPHELGSDERMKLLMPMNAVDPGTGTVQLHDGGMSHQDLLAAGTGLAGAQPVHGMVGGGGITGGSVNLGASGASDGGGGGSGHGLMYSDARAKREVYIQGRLDGMQQARSGEQIAYPGGMKPLDPHDEEFVVKADGTPEIRPTLAGTSKELDRGVKAAVVARDTGSMFDRDAQYFPTAGAAAAGHGAMSVDRDDQYMTPQAAPSLAQVAADGASHGAAHGVKVVVLDPSMAAAMSRNSDYLRSDERSKTPHMADVAMMADANRSLKPSAYEYKPEFTPPDQAPGEVNVGPMAQNMARNPLSATAVKRGPDGMLMVDKDKALRLALGSIGALQQQIDQLRGRK